MTTDLFTNTLEQSDPDVFSLILREGQRQQNHIDLIASENLTSLAVMQAQGSVLTNKYAEGYPGKRYYGGCDEIDKIEQLAIDRAKALFNCDFANVQPHSGSQANQAIFMALLKPGDKILGMDLASGGHLTHGHPMNLSGKWFDMATYGTDPKTNEIDYDHLLEIALKEKPKMIIAGFSSYPRKLDYKKFQAIAQKVGAFLLADMAHISGLVATGLHENPVHYADVVTTTTHKTLRGPRGGLILSNNADLFKKINSSVFPGIQGGPLMHVIAAKATCFKLALSTEFKSYMHHVLDNAQHLAASFLDNKINLITGGTDNHLLLLDLRSLNVTGQVAEKALDEIGIITNKNTIPFDPLPPMVTSGLRLGTPAVTSRGLGKAEMGKIGTLISHVLKALSHQTEINAPEKEGFKADVAHLMQKFPYYTT